jgi:secreted pullulanase
MRARHPVVALVAAALAACSSGHGQAGYPTPAFDAPLGVAWDAATGQATFRVWAPAASAVSVLFFDAWDSAAPASTQPLAKDRSGAGDLDRDGWNGVWQGTVAGVPAGRLYQYAVDGRPVLDPYAPSMGQFDGVAGSYQAGKGAVLDPASLPPMDLAGAATTMLPFARPDGYARREDAVVYEVHVRDYTIFDPGVAHPPGTYLAFAERLDRLRALGVTHVQLLPVLAASYGRESQRATVETGLFTQGANYNWGYDPQSWFAPEGMYSQDPTDPALRVRELKSLVNEAHRRGLGVTLDVVYNHTAQTRSLDDLAPGYFYRGTNLSGTGNDTASERKMMRKLVVDSIRHLVRTYQVDGFRFDLMGLLDTTTVELAYQAARAEKADVLFIGEGWRMWAGGRDWLGAPAVPANQDWMASTDDAAVFSDSFRDAVKGGGFGEGDDRDVGFITSTSPFDPRPSDEVALLRNLRGDPTNFTADVPGDAVQYLTAHDGLTLHDKIGKVLALDPATQEAEILKVARLGFVLQATAQGIAFVHGGCELGRSKRVPTLLPESTPSNAGPAAYVLNSYDSSDGVNGFAWATLAAAGSEGARLERYVAGLLALRLSTTAFRLGSKALAAANVTPLDLSRPYAIAYQAVDAAGAQAFSVFVNAGTSPVTLASGADLTGAAVVVDDDEAGTAEVAARSGFTLTPTSVTVAARSAVVFRR